MFDLHTYRHFTNVMLRHQHAIDTNDFRNYGLFTLAFDLRVNKLLLLGVRTTSCKEHTYRKAESIM